MKHLFIVLILFSALNCFSQRRETIQLQEQRKFKNHIEVKPINLMIGQMNVNYERVLSQKFSIEASYGHWFGVENDDDRLFGDNFALNPRYYISKRTLAPEKNYVGVYTNFITLTNRVGNDRDKLRMFENGVLFGRQWLKENGIVIDTNFGIGILTINTDDIEPDDDYDDLLLVPKSGIAIGYRF